MASVSRVGAVFLTLLALSGACADPQASGGRSASRHLDSLPMLDLVEELRVGSMSSPDTGFTEMGDVVGDDSGGVYVLEESAMQIRYYSPEGVLLRTVGRAGEGPGELWKEQPLLTAFGKLNDTLWVIQRTTINYHVVLFSSTGATIATGGGSSLPLKVHRGNANLMPDRLLPGGRLLGNLAWTFGSGTPRGHTVQPTDTVWIPRYLHDLTGAIIDTLGTDRVLPPAPFPERRIVEIQRRDHPIPNPPDSVLHHGDLLDQRYTVVSRPSHSADIDSLRLLATKVSGDTLLHETYHYRPQAYSDRLLDSLAKSSAACPEGVCRTIRDGDITIRDTFPDPPAAANAVRNSMRFPPSQPPVTGMFVGADGAVWLRRESTAAELQRWTVISPTGEPLGHVQFARGVRPMWAKGDIVWATRNETDDVPFLVRLRFK